MTFLVIRETQNLMRGLLYCYFQLIPFIAQVLDVLLQKVSSILHFIYKRFCKRGWMVKIGIKKALREAMSSQYSLRKNVMNVFYIIMNILAWQQLSTKLQQT